MLAHVESKKEYIKKKLTSKRVRDWIRKLKSQKFGGFSSHGWTGGDKASVLIMQHPRIFAYTLDGITGVMSASVNGGPSAGNMRVSRQALTIPYIASFRISASGANYGTVASYYLGIVHSTAADNTTITVNAVPPNPFSFLVCPGLRALVSNTNLLNTFFPTPNLNNNVFHIKETATTFQYSQNGEAWTTITNPFASAGTTNRYMAMAVSTAQNSDVTALDMVAPIIT